MVGASVKEEARRIVERLPTEATWDDLQYEIYVRQRIEAGLNDSNENRVIPIDEVRRQFGLEPS